MHITLKLFLYAILISASSLSFSEDTDGDGIDDSIDNCVSVSNADQVDTDSDGIGNACDADDDNDGVADSSDAFPLDSTESVDTDSDGVGNNADTDDDGDGYSDEDEIANGTPPLVFNALIGNWKLSSAADSILLYALEEDNSYTDLSAITGAENIPDCLSDDFYSFGSDGTFKNIQGATTWITSWQADISNATGLPIEAGCRAPIPPHDGSTNGSFSYNPISSSLIIEGQGSYIGYVHVQQSGFVVAISGKAYFLTGRSFSEEVPNYKIFFDVVFQDENKLQVALFIDATSASSLPFIPGCCIGQPLVLIYNLTRDNDFDDDGIDDVDDAFPFDAEESVDTDSDGIGNNADTDDDNDGVLDSNDDLPLDPTNDSDDDGVANNADVYPENNLYSADSDSDGMPDAWETKYGLNPNDASDATSDRDNDGITALDEFLAGTIPSGSIDLDGNEDYDALTDGLLLLRGMFGLDGSALVTGTIASDATYTESVDIESRIETLGDLADIDGNGDIDALSDGLLTLRYLFGLQGDTLINGVVAGDATRTTAEEIEAHLETLMPAL